MGLLDRFSRVRATTPGSTLFSAPQSAPVGVVSATVLVGAEDLEVVGESYYQDTLWAICGGVPGGERVRHPIVAILVPEPDNQYDANAIAVHVSGRLVGRLPRDVAASYRPGLHELMQRLRTYVGLDGVIVGGGFRDDGPGLLGVWLEHDPADFGVVSEKRALPPGSRTGTMRTGFTEAWLTDVEDDSYDLSWFNELPESDVAAIAMLQKLLETDPDPIDRHFQYAELETRLYRCRDLYDSALDEYDVVCERHDAEIDVICQAFMNKWGKVPLLETYRQMAIRQQKKKDWRTCLWWTERGLVLYGDAAARQDAVEDLLKRRNRALAKLDQQASITTRHSPGVIDVALTAEETPAPRAAGASHDDIEVLICRHCDARFERLRVRGRKPHLCPDCRLRTNA